MFHWSIFLCLCKFHTLLISLWCSLKSESLTLLVPFFFLKIALVLQGLMCFHAHHKIICSSFMKNTVGSLRGIVLNLLMVLGGIFILNISICPIQEHDMFLRLYVFCFLSSVLIFYLSGKKKLAQSCLTLCNPMDYTVYGIWNSPGQNTGMGSLSLIPRIFPTQGSNTGLTHCRRILYQLADKGSPRIQ